MSTPASPNRKLDGKDFRILADIHRGLPQSQAHRVQERLRNLALTGHVLWDAYTGDYILTAKGEQAIKVPPAEPGATIKTAS